MLTLAWAASLSIFTTFGRSAAKRTAGTPCLVNLLDVGHGRDAVATDLFANFIFASLVIRWRCAVASLIRKRTYKDRVQHCAMQ